MNTPHTFSVLLLALLLILAAASNAVCLTSGPADDAAAPSACITENLPSPGLNVYTRALEEDDCTFGIGARYDSYKFTSNSENQAFTLQVDSSAFRPRIELYRGSSILDITPTNLVAESTNIQGGARLSKSNLLGEHMFVVRAVPGGSGLGAYEMRITLTIIDIFPSPDFDYNDYGADPSVYRPSNNTWYIRQPGGGITSMQFGIAGDKIVPADYDGDWLTDIAVFRPSVGKWYIVQSRTQTIRVINWGQEGDMPLVRNDHGMPSDIYVFRPSNGNWYKIEGSSGNISTVQWGKAGDKPVVGTFGIGVFRPSEGRWYLLGSYGGGIRHIDWGQEGDIPVPADYDGDGRTDIGVYRPSTGQWFLIKSRCNDIQVTTWGEPGDIPVPDDYQWDGRADLVVYRPSNSRWYFLLIMSHGVSTLSIPFGEPGDLPTPSAYRY